MPKCLPGGIRYDVENVPKMGPGDAVGLGLMLGVTDDVIDIVGDFEAVMDFEVDLDGVMDAAAMMATSAAAAAAGAAGAVKACAS